MNCLDWLKSRTSNYTVHKQLFVSAGEHIKREEYDIIYNLSSNLSANDAIIPQVIFDENIFPLPLACLFSCIIHLEKDGFFAGIIIHDEAIRNELYNHDWFGPKCYTTQSGDLVGWNVPTSQQGKRTTSGKWNNIQL